MASADRNGIAGVARCLPSKVSGGARSADDVITQITISTMNQTCAPGPVPATKGNAMKAAQEIAVSTPTNTLSLPTNRATLSAAIAHRGIRDGEDRLIQHQDQDHRRWRDADAGRELWQDR